MQKLTNTRLFSDVVEQAIKGVHLTCGSTQRRDRWVSSIVKGAAFLNSKDLDEVEYDLKANRLRFTAATEDIIECGTTCECLEFESGVPCRHVAAVRLLKRYFERLNAGEEVVGVMPQGFGEGVVLECSNNECGWRGFEKQLLMPDTKEPQAGVCPKCESEVEDVTITAKTVRRINAKYAQSRKIFAAGAVS